MGIGLFLEQQKEETSGRTITTIYMNTQTKFQKLIVKLLLQHPNTNGTSLAIKGKTISGEYGIV